MMDVQFHAAIRSADDRAAAGESVDVDAPRMTYANWLDDQGDPRGEYISVSVELANDWPGFSVGSQHLQTKGHVRRCRGCQLRRRQSELLTEHAAKWFAGLYGPWTTTVRSDYIENSEGDVYLLRRGFIDEVQITAARFAGGVCQQCNGDGVNGNYNYHRESCRICKGSGRIPGLAGKVGLACPVARVVKLVGAEPYPTIADCSWWKQSQAGGQHRQSDIPDEIYTIINLREECMPERQYKFALTAALANDALEAACRRFMRTEAAELERKEVTYADTT